MNRLQGKKAIVTAAGAGIGRATAMLFAAEGADVIATDIDAGALASIDGVTARQLDVTSHQQIAALSDEVGAVDVLFNCAGYVHGGTILGCDRDAWDVSIALNVTSMYSMIQAFLPAMLHHGGGSIINMSSVAGAIIGVPDRFVYGVTKAAVIGLTRSIASDFVTQGIRCNAICPGTIQTPSLEKRLAATGDYEAARAAFVARQPMGRLGTPDEVAHLALYLASDESTLTTGQCHVIDGGWTNL
jgi:2-keto-3-deoxy-L-fuconate dehydrogenase